MRKSLADQPLHRLDNGDIHLVAEREEGNQCHAFPPPSDVDTDGGSLGPPSTVP